MDTAMRNFMLKKESIETKSKEVFSVEGGGGYAVRIEDYKATAKWQVKEQQEEEEEKTTIQKLTTFNLGKP